MGAIYVAVRLIELTPSHTRIIKSWSL